MTRPTRKNWAQCLVDDLRVFEATERSTDSSPLFTVRSRDCALAEGGEEWELAPGDRRRGGPLHEEMAQGLDGEELWQRLTAEDAKKKSNQGKPGGRGGGGSRTDDTQLCVRCR